MGKRMGRVKKRRLSVRDKEADEGRLNEGKTGEVALCFFNGSLSVGEDTIPN